MRTLTQSLSHAFDDSMIINHIDSVIKITFKMNEFLYQEQNIKDEQDEEYERKKFLYVVHLIFILLIFLLHIQISFTFCMCQCESE